MVQYIIAILLKIILLDSKEEARLEMHYQFDQEDIMKEIKSYFTNDNDNTINDTTNSTK